EIYDKAISAKWIHLQLSTYNDIIVQELETKLGGYAWSKQLAKLLILGRLAALSGYLHSSEAIPIRVRLGARAEDGRQPFTLIGSEEPECARKITSVIRKLTRNALQTSLIPLSYMAYFGKPGEGNHIGGVFPMRKQPGLHETSILGELPAFRGVHLIDASVLPDLPSAPLTYTVMANAHRIGSEVLAYDRAQGSVI